MNRLLRAALAFVIASALASHAWNASAQAAKLSAECGPAPGGALCLDGPWFEFATMKVEVVQGPVTSRYEIKVGSGRDLWARIEETTPQYAGRAEVLLIDGATIAFRNDRSLPGEGAELLNDPLLAAQEVASLLQTALPRGPRSVTKPAPVRAGGTRILAARTPVMSSYFGPPWTVEGKVTPHAGGDVAFELTFRFRIAQPDGVVTAREHVHRYAGRVSYPAKRPRLPDTMDLTGWTIALPPGSTQGSSLGDIRRSLGIAPGR